VTHGVNTHEFKPFLSTVIISPVIWLTTLNGHLVAASVPRLIGGSGFDSHIRRSATLISA